MPVGEEYIPNDVLLDDKEQQIMMITGPNMSGKSALLRQTALTFIIPNTNPDSTPASTTDIPLHNVTLRKSRRLEFTDN